MHNNKGETVPVLVVSAILMGVFVLLYRIIDPAISYLMPKCIFKMLTGYDCPSCGSQRALHALLNGQVYEAVMFNPFIFVIAPYLVAVLYASFSKSKIAISIRVVTHHYITITIYLIIYILWWVLRNTDWWKGV